jgi:hypothetical protein
VLHLVAVEEDRVAQAAVSAHTRSTLHSRIMRLRADP